MLGPAAFGAQLFFFSLVFCSLNSDTLFWERCRLNVEERGKLETATSVKDKFKARLHDRKRGTARIKRSTGSMNFRILVDHCHSCAPQILVTLVKQKGDGRY